MFLLRFGLVVFLLSFSSIGFSQDVSEAPKKEDSSEDNPPSSDRYEKVEVTGSRIRRTDFEGPSPVMLIDRTELDDTSYNSVGDYLRDLSVNSFGSTRETSGTITAGSSTINLRGLGATNTLVLLNGTRLQPNGRSGAADLNLIPEIAIDSVEILPDGASAVYGADAIGGVVQFKTRKDFTGVEVSTGYTLPDEPGGQRFDLGVIAGKQYEKVSVTGAFQYRANEFLMAKDRDWTRVDQGSLVAPTPSYRDANGWQMRPQDIAACNAGASQTHTTNSDGEDICQFQFDDFASELPEIKQYSAYLNTVWTPDSRTTLDTTVLVSNQITNAVFAPVPNDGLEVTPAGAATWGETFPGIATNSDGNYEFRHRYSAAGNREFSFDSKAFNVTSKLRREFLETWSAETTFGFGMTDTRSETSSGALLRDQLNQISSSGAYNPYSPSRDDLSPAFYTPYQETKTTNFYADSNVSGELLEMYNGLPLSIAAGLQYNHMAYSDFPDPQSEASNVLGGASSGGGGNRDFVSAYTEALIPLSKKLELQAAARVDWFSDVGVAVSPMLAAKYAPTRSLLFRSSVGKAFKAPLLQDLYAASSNGFPFIIDQTRCADNRSPSNDSCNPQQYSVEQSTNSNLEPEEAISYNIGMVYAPTSNFSFTTDFWQVNMSNVIGLNLEQVLLAESRGLTPLLNANGIEIDRSNPQNSLEKISTPNLNLSDRVQNGVNAEISYLLTTSIGNFRFADSHSHTFKFEQEAFPGLGTISLLDDYGVPRWRNTLSLTYSPNNNHSITANYGIVAGQKSSNRFFRFPTYKELDLSYQTRLPWNAQINVGVKNVLAASPPNDPNVGYDSSLFNPLGRYGFVNYRQSF